MSFEGYAQIICVNGHRYDDDCHDPRRCYVCGGKPAWINVVDQTNNPGDDVIPDEEFARFQITPETPTPGGEATYRIPADDEVAAMRYDTRYADGRFEYGRWHRDVADRLVWTPYQPPQPVTDAMQDATQEPG